MAAAPPHRRLFSSSAAAAFLMLLSQFSQPVPSAATPPPISIGVNYGANANNLPPPAQVAAFLKSRTIIGRVKLFDCNPDKIRAFAGTGIPLVVTAANGDIPSIASIAGATTWVSTNISPFHPATNISLVAIGNEIDLTGNQALIAALVPAMKAIKSALAAAGFPEIRVASPQSFAVVPVSVPPSSGRFQRNYDRAVIVPMLQFHRETKSPFFVNPYPYFEYSGETLDYAVFRPNSGKVDPVTGINYTNMFDSQLDAVYSAMKRLRYGDVEIAVGETGWPSKGQPGQVGATAVYARSYNAHLIRDVTSGRGTPLMPRRTFETYIFALFNEDLKPGPIAERNWGLFNADLTPVYDAGILRGGGGGQGGGGATPPPPPPPPPEKTTTGAWCVAKAGTSVEALQANINYACGEGGVNCAPINAGGACFDPNTPEAHASFVMNDFYQAAGRHDFDCFFSGSGTISATDPSHGDCKFSS